MILPRNGFDGPTRTRTQIEADLSDYEKRINPSDMAKGMIGPDELLVKVGDTTYVGMKGYPENGPDIHIPTPDKRTLTLPTDSAARKEYPMMSGCLNYFPAALAGVAKISKLGNDKHNPGQPLHHARGKSTDHGDCIVRHLTDVQDLLAAKDRGAVANPEKILEEVSSLAWRALALSQELHEKFGAPLAPGAKVET